MFNPLLDTFTVPTFERSWQDVSDEANKHIERAAARGDMKEAFKWLATLDLIDAEAAAYWREWGLDLYNGKVVNRPRNTLIRQIDPGSTLQETISLI